MDARDRFEKCFYGYVRSFLQLAGHDIFRENYRTSLFAYFLYIYLSMFIFNNIYSLYLVETTLDRLGILIYLLFSIMVSIWYLALMKPHNNKDNF